MTDIPKGCPIDLKPPEREVRFEKKTLLTHLFTLLLYGAAGVWWAAEQDGVNIRQDQRIQAIEEELRADRTTNMQMVERLARLEEKSVAQLEALNRIEVTLRSRH